MHLKKVKEHKYFVVPELKPKTKSGIRQAIKKYIFAIQNEIDLSNDEFSENCNRDESISINLKNGYWRINEKPLSKCSIAKQSFFDQYLRMKFIKSPIAEENSFKQRAKEVKAKFNHHFKMREQDFLGDYPNIEKLTFERKTA